MCPSLLITACYYAGSLMKGYNDLICLSKVNKQVLKSITPPFDKFISNYAKNFERKQIDLENRSLQKTRKPMTKHLSVRQCPIRWTSYPVFSLNNDFKQSIYTNISIK